MVHSIVYVLEGLTDWSSLLRIVGAAIVNILAPTPKIKPSACVNLGRSVLCRVGSYFLDITQITVIDICFSCGTIK